MTVLRVPFHGAPSSIRLAVLCVCCVVCLAFGCIRARARSPHYHCVKRPCVCDSYQHFHFKKANVRLLAPCLRFSTATLHVERRAANIIAAIGRFLFSTHSQDNFFHERIAKLTGKPRRKKWARAARAYRTHAHKPYWLIYQPFFGWYLLSIAHNAREAIRKFTSRCSGSVGQPHPSSGRPLALSRILD